MKAGRKSIFTLALDRIVAIDYDTSMAYQDIGFNGDAYYKNTIGVTVLGEENIQTIVLKVDRSNAPYVLTKPFHHSQELLERHKDGTILIQLKVHLNFELERLILGFGECIEVIKPRLLRKRISKKLEQAFQQYDSHPTIE
tara:strand:- start:126 stop:548 length:423 start_codon:yes stop_codon:yes gene_type:complete